MAGSIRTVAGDIAPPKGAVLVHEHLQIDLSHNKGPQTVLGPQDQDDIVHDLIHTREKYGLSLVAELSVPGSGRDPLALRRMSEASGVGVVAATGFYWDPIHPEVMSDSIDALRSKMVREIEAGIDDTGIRCGVIKIGTDYGVPPAPAERVFRAAAQAARATGAAIITHTSTPDQAQWQIDVLESAGADLGRVLISHLHGLQNFDDLVRYARRGVMFGFDQVGFAKGPSYQQYADLVMKCMDAGLVDQMVIASDVARRARLMRHGGTSYGTVFSELIPILRGRGASQEQLERVMNRNPCMLLSIGD